MLTQQEVIDLFDYVDGKLFWRKKLSNRVKVGDEVGCRDKRGYVRASIYNNLYWVHRVVFLYHHGYMPTFVDHINLDTGDNRIENLRAATKAQNMRNVRLRSDNRSGVKNVSWDARLGKWRVQMRINDIPTYIGVFDDLETAKFVASEYRDRYHGGFARHG